MNKYEINIFWSDEDGLYIAAVPDLPGCSAHGPTYEKALGPKAAPGRRQRRCWIKCALQTAPSLRKRGAEVEGHLLKR